jgi:glycyl-tRNA synthetase beta chain
MPDLLLEIGTEEIPARMIDAASDELSRRVVDMLDRERLIKMADHHAPSTPRRLAVIALGVAPRQPDITEQLTGPPVKAAFKDGTPTAAAHAFAKKAGVAVDQLQRVTTPKGEYLAAQVTTKGRTASEVLAEALPREIAALSWPKNMYWRAAKPERFVRPIRWIVALLDDEIIPLEFAGIRAGRESRGHRILSNHAAISIPKPGDYAARLSEASVMVNAATRRERILESLETAPASGERPKAKGSSPTTDDLRPTTLRYRADGSLLSTVVNLTEFPSVILGSFDEEFLSLPEEVLVTVMRDHQKYFAVEDANGKLAPHFLAVLNTSGDPDGLIRHGNERVLRARFNDARFFWQTDQKIPLRDRVELLKKVTFQKDLGSYYEKTMRVQRLGSLVCETLRSAGVSVRAGIVYKAALLSKTDLTTELVKEFTELQGIVGGLYARVQELNRPSEARLPDEARECVATAIYDHYKPESMDDAVPRSLEGAVLSLCDKADTIAGMFALGLIPSGSKDPFALRRQANAIIRIVAEHKLPLGATSVLWKAYVNYRDADAVAKFASEEKLAKGMGELKRSTGVMWRSTWRPPHPAAHMCMLALDEFMIERLEFYLRDALKVHYDVVNAVLASGSDDVNDAIARARAVSAVRGTDDFTSISAAFKRMKNILRQAREKNIAIPNIAHVGTGVPPVLAERSSAASVKGPSAAEVDAESSLMEALGAVLPRFQSHRAARDYAAALREMATLRQPIDLFFDKVMVMVEDTAVRGRRLALLQSIVNEFSSIADFSEIVTESK